MIPMFNEIGLMPKTKFQKQYEKGIDENLKGKNYWHIQEFFSLI
jgi:hypothetical protein